MLINGTPTSFFQIFKDLRQGNPLSPHLLVLAIEEATKEEGFISRFQVSGRGEGEKVSQLLFTNDTL